LAEGVEKDGLAFAYAFDAGGDGKIDRYATGTGEIIWAVDSNNDGKLDTDINGVAIGQTVSPANIKGVRFWLLGRSQRLHSKYSDNRQYSVGGQTVGPFNDPYKRWLLSEIIHCRNLKKNDMPMCGG
jgi:hypothetical protein